MNKTIREQIWTPAALVCPHCKGSMEMNTEEGEGGALSRQSLFCKKCTKKYPVINSIPVFLTDVGEISKEGIAVNLENAVRLFKQEIAPESTKSGRLFDGDLGNKDLYFLDVGCGIGRHLLILRNNGIRNCLGFDVMYDLVEIARKEFDLGNTFVGNALHIPLPDHSMDRCLLYNVIEHCSAPEAVLREISRILKKAGILYMDVPNARSIGDRIFRWGGLLVYGKTSHIQKFTRKKIERLLENAGFSISEIRTTRGIFLEYPQIERLGFIKKVLRYFWGNEVSGWELKLGKKN